MERPHLDAPTHLQPTRVAHIHRAALLLHPAVHVPHPQHQAAAVVAVASVEDVAAVAASAVAAASVEVAAEAVASAVVVVPVEDAGKGESNPLELSYSNIPNTPTILNNNH